MEIRAAFSWSRPLQQLLLLRTRVLFGVMAMVVLLFGACRHPSLFDRSRSVPRFGALIAGETLPFKLIVRDPLGNSFIGSSEHENPADDPKITVRRECSPCLALLSTCIYDH